MEKREIDKLPQEQWRLQYGKERAKSLNDYSPILTVADIMEILKISKPVVYKLLKNGDLKNRKIGREYKIVKSHFVDFLNTSFKGGQNDR